MTPVEDDRIKIYMFILKGFISWMFQTEV
uniref:Uncharacterized protein n=1 Tax=Anguilla anguilla TaxID=7936 RepID=A0A0E9PPU2_ANGAN